MKSLYQKIFLISLLGYLSLLTYWMLFGFDREVNQVYMYNLTPFATIRQFLQADYLNMKILLINLIGNIGVFIPFGILLPLVFGDRIPKLIIIFEVGLITLEFVQLISKRGSFDVDDIILNSIGALIGYITYKIIIKKKLL